MRAVDEQLRIVRTGAVDLITEADFRRKLGTGRSLRVKLGIDPTASDIHLGFAVVLRKLRQFQELGHTAVLIIGDFTAQVGDPSGKSATRPRLSKEEVEAYAATYVEQARRILLDEPLEIRRNSEWLGTMGIEDVLRLAARTTVARMLERDDFSRRYRDGVAISVMEFLYPLLQGWDSVMVRGRRRARRHRPALQQPHGPHPPGAGGPGGAVRAHHAAARGPRRRQQDVEVARQLRRHRRGRRGSSSASSCRCPTS